MEAAREINDHVTPDVDFVPRLRPRIHSRIRSFLEQKSLLFALVEQFRSPLNLIFPQNMQENISEFQAVYKKNHLRGRIYFTSKPCKSLALYREAAGEDVGIDISSAGSLKAALECGWQNERIGATGPKNKAYITAALQNDVLINVDNIEELQQIAALRRAMGNSGKTRIMVRVSDVGQKAKNTVRTEDSTFGIHTDDMTWVFEYLQTNIDILDFQGFAYHASMASDEQRIAAMENQLRLTFAALQKGLKPSKINVGGGFRVTYADSHQEWIDYIDSLKQSVLRKMPQQIWNNSDLGYRVENGAIRGDGAFIHHAPVYTKAQELERWLDFRLPLYGNIRFADLIRDSLLQLHIEPGRALLDQCGITIGRVAYTKRSIRQERLIGIEMNATNIHADKFKVLTEPLVISQREGVSNAEREGVYYIGNLCMSHDMLRYNKTYPDILPQSEDLVIFPNTAAYMMDFMESETLMQPVAKKIALTENDGAWQWTKDADYRRNT
jgi:diaminopimelate decarboxylase